MPVVGGVQARLLHVQRDLGHLFLVVPEDQPQRLALEGGTFDQRAQLELDRAVGRVDVGLERVVDARRDQDLEVAARQLAQAVVLRQQALVRQKRVHALDLVLRDVRRVRIVVRQVPLVREAEVHEPQLGRVGVQRARRTLEQLLRLRGRRGQLLEGGGREARDELGVAEALVVADVAEELRGVLEEVLDVIAGDAGLPVELAPVAAADLVQGQDEVEDGLGLGADLAQHDARAQEGGSCG